MVRRTAATWNSPRERAILDHSLVQTIVTGTPSDVVIRKRLTLSYRKVHAIDVDTLDELDHGKRLATLERIPTSSSMCKLTWRGPQPSPMMDGKSSIGRVLSLEFRQEGPHTDDE